MFFVLVWFFLLAPQNKNRPFSPKLVVLPSVCSYQGPPPLLLAPCPQILILPVSLHTNQTDHHKVIERVTGRKEVNTILSKQDKPSLLMQSHDSLEAIYEGQMLSTSKLLQIASTVCVGGGEGNNQHLYIFIHLPGNVFILFSNQDLPQARRSTPNE